MEIVFILLVIINAYIGCCVWLDATRHQISISILDKIMFFMHIVFGFLCAVTWFCVSGRLPFIKFNGETHD